MTIPSHSSKPILVIEGLTKRYQPRGFCLGPLDLSIESGLTMAFLGKNGAGKSTFFQIVTGNLDPTSGSVRLLDQPMKPDQFLLKRRIGYLPQTVGLPNWVTPKELLSYACSLHQLQSKCIDEQIDYWDCRSYANRPIGKCSHGMQKRVGLGLVFLHNPDFMILDEPFTGLDLHHIKNLKEAIKNRQLSQKTTMLCTHIAPFAAELCQAAVILKEGQIAKIPAWSSQSPSERIGVLEIAFCSE